MDVWKVSLTKRINCHSKFVRSQWVTIKTPFQLIYPDAFDNSDRVGRYSMVGRRCVYQTIHYVLVKKTLFALNVQSNAILHMNVLNVSMWFGVDLPSVNHSLHIVCRFHLSFFNPRLCYLTQSIFFSAVTPEWCLLSILNRMSRCVYWLVSDFAHNIPPAFNHCVRMYLCLISFVWAGTWQAGLQISSV